MQGKALKGGEAAYYWSAPAWARAHPTPPATCAQSLGTDYAEAKRECDDVLNPMFDSWRETRDLTPAERDALRLAGVNARIPVGTFDWLEREFLKHEKFLEDVGELTQAHYRDGLKLIAEFKLRNDPRGRRFGQLALSSITGDAVDRLIKALKSGPDGKKRGRVVYKAIQAARRAWNVVGRKNAKLVTAANPFARTGMKAPKKGRSKPAAQSELRRFMSEADKQGHPSMACAALISWEWMVREKYIVGIMAWSAYRSGNTPTSVHLPHTKNLGDDMLEMPLVDPNGEQLFPELEARLLALPKRGTLMIMRDEHDRFRKQHLPYKLNKFQKLARKLLDDAGLQHLKFESFRKGGETECGDAGLTDQETMALDGHETRDMLTVYQARTKIQRIHGMLKRRELRTKMAHLSE